MVASSLSWILTLVFGLTGLYSLLRLAELDSGPDRSGSRVAELSHLLMSIAMIAMTWAWSGDTSSASGLLEVAVFGLVALWFLLRLALPVPGHSRVGDGYHLVMNAAMVWMVAAMPLLMGSATAAGTGEGHDHAGGDEMASMPGMGAAAGPAGAAAGSSATPTWAITISWLVIVMLAASAVFWVVRALRAVEQPSTSTPGDGESRPDTGAISGLATKVGTGGVVAVAVPAPILRVPGPLLDAGCHLLMSVGMAGMLLAMLPTTS